MRKNEESWISRIVEDGIFVAGIALMVYVANQSTRNKPAPKRDFIRDR